MVTVYYRRISIIFRFISHKMVALVNTSFFQIYMCYFLLIYYSFLNINCSDQIITLQETGKSHRIIGITPDMGLLRTIPVGAIGSAPSKYVDLQPDGNSFDMLKGLIRTK